MTQPTKNSNQNGKSNTDKLDQIADTIIEKSETTLKKTDSFLRKDIFLGIIGLGFLGAKYYNRYKIFLAPALSILTKVLIKKKK